jgi:hypothetical protein
MLRSVRCNYSYVTKDVQNEMYTNTAYVLLRRILNFYTLLLLLSVRTGSLELHATVEETARMQ